MAKFKAEDIRNIILAGHGGSGKTTLLDEFLFAAKANNRIGSVKDGSSLSDTAEDEIDGKASIDLSILHGQFGGKLFHFFDTPGRSDFVGQYFAALGAAENVLIVVDGYSGIQVNTRKSYKIARDEGKTVGFVVTKLDMENVNFGKVVADIRKMFGKACVPFFVPDTTGPAISKVVSVLDKNAASPAAKEHFEPLVEAVVEANEELMMRYLEGEDVSAEVPANIAAAIKAGVLVPILCFGQKGSVGVKETLQTVADYFPSAALDKADVVNKADDGTVTTETVPLDPNAFAARVFKVVVDEHKGRMALMRAYSGSTVPGATFHNVTSGRGRSGKFGKLFKFFGAKQEEVDSVGAGEIFAAAKIEELDVGDTVSDGTWTRTIKLPKSPRPMVALAIRPKTRGDEQRLSPVLQRFALEDRTFRYEVDSQSKEMIAYGVSELHLNVVLQRMKRRTGVEVETKLPKISYRETITREVADYHRHKKQSGGSGEFAEVHLKLRPYRGEENFVFNDALRGDNVRRQFVPSVEKGCRAIMADGILTGSPVIRIEVDFFDGKDHPVDGKDSAFQKAARGAFKKCFLAANPVLLEPTVNLEVTFPSEFAGEVNQYINSHRGRIQGMDMLGEEQVVRATIPLAEVQTFSSDLRAMTQGQGSYSMEDAGFDQVPAHVQSQVVAAFAKNVVEEE
jgi:elongation factor G